MTYDVPTEDDAALYADAIASVSLPVMADPHQAMIDASGWDGTSMPGLCVLAPDMTMLDCWAGEDDERAKAAILAHHAGN